MGSQEIKTASGRGLSLDVTTLTEFFKKQRDAMARTSRLSETHWSGWYAAYVVARERGSSDEAARMQRPLEGALADRRKGRHAVGRRSWCGPSDYEGSDHRGSAARCWSCKTLIAAYGAVWGGFCPKERRQTKAVCSSIARAGGLLPSRDDLYTTKSGSWASDVVSRSIMRNMAVVFGPSQTKRLLARLLVLDSRELATSLLIDKFGSTGREGAAGCERPTLNLRDRTETNTKV